MSDLIAITGNLTSPPTRHDVAGGVAMVTFGLASTERRFENGTWHDVHTNFYNVSVFRKLAEHAYASLEKGQRVILSGKLKVRHWEANGRTGTSVDLEATMLTVVAEKTGYPAEMIDVNMDMEADLGIDSIKRVEILSAMKQKVADLPQVPNAKMAATRAA